MLCRSGERYTCSSWHTHSHWMQIWNLVLAVSKVAIRSRSRAQLMGSCFACLSTVACCLTEVSLAKSLCLLFQSGMLWLSAGKKGRQKKGRLPKHLDDFAATAVPMPVQPPSPSRAQTAALPATRSLNRSTGTPVAEPMCVPPPPTRVTQHVS